MEKDNLMATNGAGGAAAGVRQRSGASATPGGHLQQVTICIIINRFNSIINEKLDNLISFD